MVIPGRISFAMTFSGQTESRKLMGQQNSVPILISPPERSFKAVRMLPIREYPLNPDPTCNLAIQQRPLCYVIFQRWTRPGFADRAGEDANYRQRRLWVDFPECPESRRRWCNFGEQRRRRGSSCFGDNSGRVFGPAILLHLGYQLRL